MTNDAGAAAFDDPLASVDPWVTLLDGRSQLLRAIDGLDAADAARPAHAGADDGAGWTIADLLTHLAAWDELTARLLRAIASPAGAAEPLIARDGEWAAWNAARVAERQGDALEARIERLHAARAELTEAAAALMEAPAFDAPVDAPWGVSDSPRAFLVAQAMHDGMHAETIAAARGEARDDRAGR